MREHPSLLIHALWEWSKFITTRESVCEGCVEVLCEGDRAERRRIWDALP